MITYSSTLQQIFKSIYKHEHCASVYRSVESVKQLVSCINIGNVAIFTPVLCWIKMRGCKFTRQRVKVIQTDFFIVVIMQSLDKFIFCHTSPPFSIVNKFFLGLPLGLFGFRGFNFAPFFVSRFTNFATPDSVNSIRVTFAALVTAL